MNDINIKVMKRKNEKSIRSSLMKRNVEIELNVDYAREMFVSTGIIDTSEMTDEEVFDKVLLKIEEIGVLFGIQLR